MAGRTSIIGPTRFRHRGRVQFIDDGSSLSTDTGYMFPRDPAFTSTVAPVIAQMFETVSWKWSATDFAAGRNVLVRWKYFGENEWFEAFPAAPDTRTWTQADYKMPAAFMNQYRSMITDIDRDSTIVIQLLNAVTGEFATVQVPMWPWELPNGAALISPLSANRSTRLTITSGGTWNAYGVVDLNGRAIELTNDTWAIDLGTNARYVKIINGTIRGPSQHCAYWQTAIDAITTDNQGRPLTHFENVVFENWGRPSQKAGFSQFGENYNSAIKSTNSRSNLQARLSVRRCVFRNPRHRSNFWTEPGDQGTTTTVNKHPSGPQCITIEHTSQQGRFVVTDSHAYCDNGNVFNDAFGGSNNRTMRGFPGWHTDFARNIVTDVADDIVEGDGPNENVLYRDNYFERFYTGGSSAPVIVGPVFWVRNVMYDSRNAPAAYLNGEAHGKDAGHKSRMDQDWRTVSSGTETSGEPFFSGLASGRIGGGQEYYIHNTMPRLPTHTSKTNPAHKGVRVGFGMQSGTTYPGYQQTQWINNIITGFDRAVFRGTDSSNFAKGNLCFGINEVPAASASLNINNALPSYVAGTWRLASGSVGRETCDRVPGFTPPFTGARPDPGAWQQGYTPTYGPT